jgi:hypothetical protein
MVFVLTIVLGVMEIGDVQYATGGCVNDVNPDIVGTINLSA